MDFEWTEEYTKRAVVGVILIILLAVLLVAIFIGRDLARTSYTLKQTARVMEGLKFFHEDNDRYPSELEFTKASVMSAYLPNFPLKPVLSKKCPEGIKYETFDRLSYRLTFCLPRSSGRWQLGSSSVNQLDDLSEYLK